MRRYLLYDLGRHRRFRRHLQNENLQNAVSLLRTFLKKYKMVQPRPLFRLFSVFSNKQYNFTKNQCEKSHVHLVYGAGI